MTDTIAQLGTILTGDARALDRVLAKAERDLQAFERRASRRPAAAPVPAPAIPGGRGSGGGGSGGPDPARAEAATLRLAQARAHLAREAGDLAGAERTLSTALSGVTRESTTSIGAQRQLARIQRELAVGASGAATHLQVLPRTIAGFSGDAAGLATTVGRLAAGFVAAGGAMAAFEAGKAALDFAQAGEGIAQAARSFDSLAASAGTSGDAILASLQQVSQGTVANASLIKSSNTALLLLGNDVASQLPQLLSIAKASATTLGADVGQLFDNLVTGIARGSTELLDNLGISISATEAYEQYAASIGTSVNALTKAQRSQAVLNAVLAQGADIIARSGGEADRNAVAFQRADAALANFTATAQVAAARALAPLVSGFADAADGGEQLIARLTGQGNQFTQQAAAIAATATSYDAYVAGVGGANAQVDAAILKNQGLITTLNGLIPGLGGAVTGLLQYTAQTQTLSEAQFRYVQALTAQGVAAEQAVAQAQEQSAALNGIQGAIDSTGGALDVYAGRLATVAAAGEGYLAAALALAGAFSNQQITAEQLAAGLADLEASARLHAQATTEQAASTYTANDAIQQAIDENRNATTAINEHAFATLEQAAQAGEAAQRHAELEQAIMNAANAGGSAAAAAARIAAQFNGVEAPAIVNLINLHRELAAARAQEARAAQATVAVANQRAGERDPSRAVGRAVALEQYNTNRLRYEQQQQREIEEARRDQMIATGNAAQVVTVRQEEYNEAVRQFGQNSAAAIRAQTALINAQKAAARAGTSGGGRGGRGSKGGGGSTTDRAAEQEARAAQDRAEKIADLEERYHDQALAAETRYQEDRLAIIERFQEALLDAQRDLQAESAASRADFYDSLTSSDLPQDVQQSLSAAYEAAFAEAQRLSQEGKAGLAADYLALKEQQLAAEQRFQEAVAAAREKGDKGEIARLEAIKRLRDAEFAARESNLLAEGDADVTARDAALDAAAEKRQEDLNSAQENAARAALEAEEKTREAAQLTNEAYLERLRLLQSLGGAPVGGGSSLPTPGGTGVPAAPGGVSLPAGTPGGASGPLPVTDAGVLAALDGVRAAVRSVEQAVGRVGQRSTVGGVG